MEIGKQGVDIAGKAVGTAIASIFNGKSDQAEQEMKAQGDRIEAAAMKLCDQMQPMLKTQQELAASLPAFKPYAKLEQSDIDDCRKQIETFRVAEGGFILSSGCEFPPNGNLLSAKTMVQTAKVYGRY